MKPESIQTISIDQFKNIMKILKPCMNDYLFIYDLRNDYYCISPRAVERFRIAETEFNEVNEHLKAVVCPDDMDMLMEDLGQVIRGEKDFHNLQYRWLDKKGKPVWINCRGQVSFDEKGRPEYLVGCINEIGRKPKADNVSGLLSETAFRHELRQRSKERMHGFMLHIGIDRFKEINENKGMDYGDMILRKTAECISAACSSEQMVYRMVADEFVVVDFSENVTEADAKKLYNKIRWKLDLFIEDNEYEVFYTVSAGILMFDNIVNQETLNVMKLSEYALNEAKNRGKNKSYIYRREDYQEFLRKKELIRIMRYAIQHDFAGFEVNFQPIMYLSEERFRSAETLTRFTTEEGVRVSPAEFIPLLEESGLIIPVGKWILQQAMQTCCNVRRVIPDFRISVNVSYVQVLKSDVLTEIVSTLKEYDLPPDSIIVELTESGFLEQNENFIRFCEGLQQYGIPLALDDFGTGYSNFHYLYSLSPNTIKVDRTFTLKALNNDYEYTLLRHIIDMAHSIGLKFCVEGIETQKELTRISRIKPDYIQGYFFGKPSPYQVFMENYILSKEQKI